MKKPLFISSYDDNYSYPSIHTTLEEALKYESKFIAKVYVEIPVDEQEAIAEKPFAIDELIEKPV